LQNQFNMAVLSCFAMELDLSGRQVDVALRTGGATKHSVSGVDFCQLFANFQPTKHTTHRTFHSHTPDASKFLSDKSFLISSQ